MKKNSLLVLLAAVGLMVSCGGTSSEEPSSSESSSELPSSSEVVEAEAAFFGFGSKASYASKGTAGTAGQYLQIDITVGAFLFDADGAVVKAYVDVMQVKVNSIDGTNVVIRSGSAVNSGSDVKSKRELGTAYNMAGSANKGEWFVQADAWQDFIVGLTAEEAVAANDTAELLATVTITTDDYSAVLTEAAAGKTAITAVAPENIMIGTGMLCAQAAAQSTITVIGAAFDATDAGTNQVIASVIDAYQPPYVISNVGTVEAPIYNVAFNETKVQVDVTNSAIKSKRDLGDLYGMSSAPKGEWYVQANAWQAFVIGKTVTEIAASNGTEALLATVTIHTIDFETIIAEALKLRV